MEQPFDAMNAPPQSPPPQRRGVRRVALGAILIVALGVAGVSSVLAASPSPSASGSGKAAASPAPNHVCDRTKTQSSSSSSSS